VPFRDAAFVAETALKPAAVFRKQREDLIFVCLICFDPFEGDTGDLNKGQRTFIFRSFCAHASLSRSASREHLSRAKRSR